MSRPSAAVSGVGQDVIGRAADGIRRRLAELRRADEALAAFAFSDTDRPGPAAAADVTHWRHHAAQALQAISDPTTLALVAALDGGQPTLDELSRTAAAAQLAGDRIALAAAIGQAAAAGLVVRRMETDRVVLTPLGESLLALVDELANRAAEGDR